MTLCPACPCCKNWIHDDCIAKNPLIRKHGRLTMRNDYCSHFDHITGSEFAVTAANHEAANGREDFDSIQVSIVDGKERGLRVLRQGPEGIVDVTPWHVVTTTFVPTGPLGDKFMHYALGVAKILRKGGFNGVTINGKFIGLEDLKNAPRLRSLVLKRKPVEEEDED